MFKKYNSFQQQQNVFYKISFVEKLATVPKLYQPIWKSR